MKKALDIVKFDNNDIKGSNEMDDSLKELINILNIPIDLLKKYNSRLEDSAKEFKNCKDCPCLSSCKNEINGYYLFPTVNEKTINFSYNICRYMQKEKYKENLVLFDIPKAIKQASMKEIYKTDKNRIPIIKELTNFLNNYNKVKNIKGIYLHGSFGSGKTYLIAALFNELAKKNIHSVIVHVPELLRCLKESFSNDYSARFYELKHTPLLLLDDIGAEYLTQWGRDEVIEPILQYRMDENLPTFFTSNFTIDELEKHFSTTSGSVDKVKSKRIIERIKQLTTQVELSSENLRK